MKLTVTKNNSNIDIHFDSITQLCGQNIAVKNYILDSICKHFSSDKYKDYEETYINNVMLDGEIPGRKQWECYRICDINDLVSTIQLSKGGILGKCIKECINSFECQNELLEIDNILLKIFTRLNQEIFENGIIELQYAQEDLFSMIQQTSVKTKNGEDLHTLSIGDLLQAFIEIVTKQQDVIPEKRLYVFENIDHYMNADCYVDFVRRCEELTKKSNVWFIYSTSIDGYVYISEEAFETINVINDEIFIMPSEEHIIDFIQSYYPIERVWNHENLIKMIADVVQDIGKKNALGQPENVIFLKLLNETMGIKCNWHNKLSSPEIQCLMDADVV